MDNRTDKEMPRTASDPHHNGVNEWGWDGQYLWHRMKHQRYWTRTNRIHPTPARVRVLADLMIKLHPPRHWAADLL